MKRRQFVQGTAAAAVLGAPHLSGLAQQVVTLKFHTFMAPMSNVWLTMHKPWMEKVEKDSGGRIKFEGYPAMQLGGTPVQLYDQARDGVVGAILLFYVVLGAVMDELSMLLLTIPIFFPMIMGLDFGMPKESVAIWFGIMVLMTVGFGMLAPPVGLNVYVVNALAKDVPIAESYRGVMPFLISDTLRTLLLLFFPPISLYLVKYIG